MFIYKKGRLFGKVSLVDVILILAVAAAAVFVVNGLGVNRIITPGGADVTYISFHTEQAPDCVTGFLPVGGRVMDEAKGVDLGRITNVIINEGYDYHPNEQGQMVKSAKYGYSELTITSAVRGVMDERGLWVDGNRYIVGHSMSVIAGDAIIYMRVSGLEGGAAQ